MKHTEHKFQVQVARLLDASGLLWTAIPNGGKRSAITGAILKAEGVKAGFPDVAILEPFHIWGEAKACGFVSRSFHFSGVFIELKNGKAGRVSPAQKEWIEALRKRGYRAEVARTMDEVLDLLHECYPNKITK